MQPNEIFELIIKADEKLKYSNAGNMELRKRQARELLVQALEAARELGNEQLVGQARLARARPQQRLGEGDQRRVIGPRGDLAGALRGRLRWALAPARDRREQLPRAPSAAVSGADTPDLLELGT